MKYPGRVIKVGEGDGGIVRAVKVQLNKGLGIEGDPELRLNPDDQNFGPRMRQTVKLFQARNVDAEGRPLKQDGEIGSLTWSALFGNAAVPAYAAATGQLLTAVLAIASAEEAMRAAISAIGLDHMWIVYPGEQRYRADEKITAWPVIDVASLEVG